MTENSLYDGPEAQKILRRSLIRWHAAVDAAASCHSIPTECTNLVSVLGTIPALPRSIPRHLKSIAGCSTWDNLDTDCSLRAKTGKPLECQLRSRYPLRCILSTSENFRRWDESSNNGIALFIVAWAYVLTVSLAERQGLELEYFDTPIAPSTARRIMLDLGDIDRQELLWWKALLSHGIHWRMTDGSIMPWALHTDDLEFGVTGDTSAIGYPHPPTSVEAAQYIERLSRAYKLGTQSSAALASVICLPIHRTGPKGPSVIEFPEPSLEATNLATTSNLVNLPQDFEHLDYYMTLSTSKKIGCCLYTILWEHGITCNHAGAWVGGMRAVLKPLIQEQRLELFAKALSFTKLAPLWLGITLCGQTVTLNRFSQSLDDLYWKPWPNADMGRWTSTAQSFLDLRANDPYVKNGMVSRADVWRLRFDCDQEYADDDDDYSLPPPNGWQPFGNMRVEDVDLQLRGHLNCSHRWKLSNWSWSHGISLSHFFKEDQIPQPSVSEPAIFEQAHFADNDAAIQTNVSKQATEEMFRWCRNQVEEGFSCFVAPGNSGLTTVGDESPRRPTLTRDKVTSWAENVPVDCENASTASVSTDGSSFIY